MMSRTRTCSPRTRIKAQGQGLVVRGQGLKAQGQGLVVRGQGLKAQGQGLVNWCSKDFPRGQHSLECHITDTTTAFLNTNR